MPAAHLGLHMPYYVAATSNGIVRPLVHRPGAPCTRRSSSPETLRRLKLAIQELSTMEDTSVERTIGDPDSPCRMLCLYDHTSGFIDQQQQQERQSPDHCYSFWNLDVHFCFFFRWINTPTLTQISICLFSFHCFVYVIGNFNAMTIIGWSTWISIQKTIEIIDTRCRF